MHPSRKCIVVHPVAPEGAGLNAFVAERWMIETSTSVSDAVVEYLWEDVELRREQEKGIWF